MLDQPLPPCRGIQPGRPRLWPLRLALLLALVGCSSTPSAEDWLAVGFDSPAQTLRTFQTGLRGNNPDLEYDSFSAGFRRELGLSRVVYYKLRDEVFGRYPYLRRFVALEVVRELEQGPRERSMIVRLSAFLSERWVEVQFVRDDYFSVRSGAEVLADDYASFASMITSDGGRLVLILPTEDIIDPREVTKVLVGQDWKINGFRQLEEDEVAALVP